jgi:hypothetical protein
MQTKFWQKRSIDFATELAPILMNVNQTLHAVGLSYNSKQNLLQFRTIAAASAIRDSVPV